MGRRARKAEVLQLGVEVISNETWPFGVWPYLYLRLMRSEDIWVPLIVNYLCFYNTILCLFSSY